jgi:hypothetical protein
MARIGHGSTVTFARDGDTFNLGGVTDIQVSGLSMATVDATDMDSPDRFQQFIAGLRDGGEVTLTLQSQPVGLHEFTRDENGPESGIQFAMGMVYGNPATLADAVPVILFTTGSLPEDLDQVGAGVVYLVEGGLDLPGSYFVFDGPSPTGTVISVISDGAGTHYAAALSQRWVETYWRFLQNAATEFTLTFPSGSTLTADILVTNIGVPIPMADKITTNVTLKITGVPVWGDPA